MQAADLLALLGLERAQLEEAIAQGLDLRRHHAEVLGEPSEVLDVRAIAHEDEMRPVGQPAQHPHRLLHGPGDQVLHLGGRPRYPMANPNTFRTPEALTDWLVIHGHQVDLDGGEIGRNRSIDVGIIGDTGLYGQGAGLAYDEASGTLYSVAGDGNLYTLNTSTGDATLTPCVRMIGHVKEALEKGGKI